jgi:hypothetical protein
MPFKNSVNRSVSRKRTTRFRSWIIVISVFVAGAVVAVLVAIGVQRHNDQQLAAEMIRSEVELQTTGLGFRVLRTMNSRPWRNTLTRTCRLHPCWTTMIINCRHTLIFATELNEEMSGACSSMS